MFKSSLLQMPASEAWRGRVTCRKAPQSLVLGWQACRLPGYSARPPLMGPGLCLGCAQLSGLVFMLLMRAQVGPPSLALGCHSWLSHDLPTLHFLTAKRFDSISNPWHNPQYSQPPYHPENPSNNISLTTLGAFIS